MRCAGPVQMRRIRNLTLAATVATFALIAVGGLVRATGSGLGCPGWPRCFGRWIPPLEYHPIIEYSHRLLATIVVVLVGAVLAVAIRRHRSEPRILWPPVAAVVLVIGQAALGAIVVEGELPPALVALLVLYLAIRIWTLPVKDRTLSRLAVALVALFAAQILAGALNVWTQLAPAAVVAHVTLAGLIWGTTVAIATLSARRARLWSAEPVADPSSNGHRKLKERLGG